MNINQHIVFCLLLGVSTVSPAQFSQQELDWLHSDAEHPATTVNEGEIEFFATEAAQPEHQQTMRVTLTGQSITSGWVAVEQCHEALDRVDRLEIVFHPERTRDLQVLEYHNIGKAWREGPRVIVRHVRPHSRICLRSESRVLRPLQSHDSTALFEIVNGPFMRRFLDGYYPLTLALEVVYPQEILQLRDARPLAQPGWEIQRYSGRVSLHGRFAGKLSTRLQFERLTP